MEFIEDLLSHLEAETSDLARKPNMTLYSVPSTVTVSGLCPQNLPQDELQRAIAVSFGHKRQVIDTTICLLGLFTTPPPSRPKVALNSDISTSDDSWTLNVLTRFWEAIIPKGAQLNYVEISLSSMVSFMDRIRVYLPHASGLDHLPAVVQRVSTLCSQVTTTFLVREPLPLPSPIEKSLCLVLLDLALIYSKFGLRLQGFAGDSLSGLFEVRKDHKRFDVFGQDLQVCVGRCFS